MLVAFAVWPSITGEGDSVREAVAAAVKIVRASGLPNRTDSMFTTIEGEWDEVFGVIHRAADTVASYGSRVDLIIKADIRPGHINELDGKLQRLEQSIAGPDLS
jgi:uncharacterized protein YqgV (UPF0045/DUF77 family)